MRNLGHLLLASIVGLMVSQSLAAISIRPQTPATAVLKGAVFDLSREAVVLDEKVVVENLQTGQVWRLITDDAGTYSATLPAGTYSITTEGSNWSLPFRRAPFRLHAGSSSTLNIVLSPRILTIALTVARKGKYIEWAPPQRYESFATPGAASDLLKLLIQYETKRTSNDRTVYKWTKLSFDLVTVYADELVLDRKTLRLRAYGRVMVEDGKQRRKLPSAAVHFKDGNIIVEHDRESTAGTFQTEPGQRAAWRGIIPLKSTRAQVERLGFFDAKCQCYETQTEIVHVEYASGRCTGDLPGWNVSADTVLSFSVTPKSDRPFSEYESRKEVFVETRDHTFTTFYGDGNRGIRYSVTYTGLVGSISYVPSVRDNHLRCRGFPPTDGGITDYNRFDEFGFTSLGNITERLGNFISRLQNSDDYKGYIVVYAPHKNTIRGVRSFAGAARNYVLKKFKTDPKTIKAINGGYREEAYVELFLIPIAWPPPVPTPTFGAPFKSTESEH